MSAQNAKPTPGEWTVNFSYSSDIPENARVVIHAPPKSEKHTGTKVAEAEFACQGSNYHVSDRNEAEANARLIAEAGTVYHETGLTPRQLADQRAELLEALRELATEEYRDDDDPILHKARSKARAAIQRATGE